MKRMCLILSSITAISTSYCYYFFIKGRERLRLDTFLCAVSNGIFVIFQSKQQITTFQKNVRDKNITDMMPKACYYFVEVDL